MNRIFQLMIPKLRLSLQGVSTSQDIEEKLNQFEDLQKMEIHNKN